MENKFCVSCGQQLEAGAKFCPHCGASQPVEQNQQPQAGTTQPQAPQMQQQPTQAQPAQPQTPPVQPQAQQQTPPVQPTPQQGYQQNGYQQAGQQGQYQQPAMKPKVTFKQLKNQIPGQAGPQPELNFIDSVKYTIANIIDFKTPESRKSVYWWNSLAISIVDIAVFILILIIKSITANDFYYTGFDMIASILMILLLLANIPMLLSNVSAAIRRINYLGENPWLVLVPGYSTYLLLIDKRETYYQQPGQYQQYQQQQNMNQMPNMNQAPNQMPQQPVQNQQPVQQNNNDQNTPQN